MQTIAPLEQRVPAGLFSFRVWSIGYLVKRDDGEED
jgi:hypothetical protein